MKKPLHASDMREKREFACESKFLVSSELAAAIQSWARSHLSADPHGGGDAGDTYEVSSVYFDTANHCVYRRIGSYGRSKYRVRRYGDSDRVFLERKTKTNSLVCKRRSLVELGELRHLRGRAPERDAPSFWFHRRLLARSLEPVCQISYVRTARMGDTEYGPCRLTLDRELRALRTGVARYADSEQAIALMNDRWILELKYRYSLPALFKRLLAELAPTPQRLSKYRLAVEALELAAGDSEIQSEEAYSELTSP